MTRRDRRRNLKRWLSDLFSGSRPKSAGDIGVARRRRGILVEPLESRQLLAGDGFSTLLDASDDHSSENYGTAGLVGEGEGLAPEGEPADDLVAFAQALADSGTRFFGAAWCPFCTDQKELFQDGYKYLPFIEVTNPDRSPNQIAIDEGITEYPTWEFPDGTRATGLQSLQVLSDRSGVAIPQSSTPSIDELPDTTVRIGSPLHVPIDAYDPNGNPLTISVTSSDPNLLTAEVLENNRSLRLSTANFGDMVFELFENRAPRPSGRVIQLAEDGFYDGVTFHRVINNFVIQGGDPTGTGTGGSSLGDFDDQFHVDLQHNQTGVLSYAKSTDDTNDSQFFITEGPQRFLDFNHSVFGQLVEGEEVRESISNTAVNASDRPTNDVVIESASIFEDTENGVILLKATGNGTGTATITVTVSDTEGNQTSESFDVSVQQDNANGAPFLDDIPDATTSVNVPLTLNLSSQDAEGDQVVYSVQALGAEDFNVSVDSATGEVTLQPPTDFVGQLQFRATVQQTTSPTTSSPDDNQIVTVNVVQSAPTGIDLLASSDTGSSDSDDITNSQSLTFQVSGTVSGATVEVRSGGTVVGSATASGNTTEVSVSDVSGLGQGAVLFTATQTIGGETSAASPSLSVTLDNVQPEEIAGEPLPANIIVDENLNVDLSHPEEGQGLVYTLSSAPNGMTIDSATGEISWTPSAAQLGAQSVELQLTDTAGNSRQQSFSITVIETPRVSISLNVVDQSGSPITTVGTGETFTVQVLVEDLRDGASATGVFSGYVDLLYDSAVIEPVATDPITNVSPYTNDPSGDTDTAGIINELGGFSSTTERLGSDPRLLAEVTFVARATGNAGLQTEAADDVGNDVLLFDESDAVPESRVQFGNSNFAVGANFELVDDVYNFDEDTGPHTLDVLSNDTVEAGAVLTITSVSTASGGGTVTINSNGDQLSYTPAANFNGAETFTYTAENQGGVSLTGTVTIQVTDVNDPPDALNDTFTVSRNSTNNVLEVLDNDTDGVDDSQAETLRVTAVSSGSAGGQIVVGPSGFSIRYTPAADFEGTETFTYTLSDGRGGTDTATVSVAVNQDNPPPTPQNDSFTVEEDASQASFDVLANDTTDDSEETLSVSAVGTSQQGSIIAVASDGLSILYQPGPNFNGQEIIPYTLQDSGGATAEGLVTFNVTAVNDAPNAEDDSVTALSANDSNRFNLLDNDTTVDSGETLTIIEVTQPPSGNGSLEITDNGTTVTYTPPSSSFEGNFSFTYTLSDGSDLTDTANVDVSVENFVPRDVSGVVIDSSETDNSGLGGITVRLRGSDFSGSPVEASAVVNMDGSYRFEDLPPGEYTLERDPLPFLMDEGLNSTVVSNVEAGDAISDLLVSGALHAKYIDIRDFLGSKSQHSMAVALNSDGTHNWISSRGDWSEFSTLNVSLASDSNSLAIVGVNGQQENVSASVPIANQGLQVYEAGRESNMRLMRIRATAASVGFSPVTSSETAAATQSSLTAEGEGDSSSPLSFSESQTSASGAAVPVVQSPSFATSSDLGENGTSRVSGFAGTKNAPTPSDAIRRLLGSTTGQRAASHAAQLDVEAVDQSMQDVLPALRLELASDLQQSLAEPLPEGAAQAADDLFGQL